MRIEGLGKITNTIVEIDSNHSLLKIKKMIKTIDITAGETDGLYKFCHQLSLQGLSLL